MVVPGNLCLTCGLCCNGVLFRDVELQPGDDAAKLAALGLPLRHRSKPSAKSALCPAASALPKFPQPCAALDGCCCRIYSERPARCRNFDCALLRAVQSSQVDFASALRTVRATRQRADHVLRLLRELGDQDELLPLSRRFRRMKRRLETTLPNDEIAETFSQLTLAVHDLNLQLRREFYPDPAD